MVERPTNSPPTPLQAQAHEHPQHTIGAVGTLGNFVFSPRGLRNPKQFLLLGIRSISTINNYPVHTGPISIFLNTGNALSSER